MGWRSDMGEKQSLIEPLLASDKPKQRIVFAIGFFIAVGDGTAFGIFSETINGRIQGSQRLATVSGQMPLVTVPVIKTARERFKMTLTNVSVIFLCCLICAFIVSYLGLYVVALKAIWTALLNRFGVA
ncbi:MAG: hypothetical protein ABWY00_16595 [Dongiaceae bacterium]